MQSFQFEGLGHQQDTSPSEGWPEPAMEQTPYSYRVGIVLIRPTVSECSTIPIDSDSNEPLK